MKSSRNACIFLLVAASLPAWAHGPSLAMAGFAAGFGHPFTGLDHLAAMIAVGAWATAFDRGAWKLPAAFLAAMSAGAAFGLQGNGLPGVEYGIAASVIVSGVLAATQCRFSLPPAAAVAALFGLFHGHAHGTELPAGADGLLFGLGVVAATACLHAVGLAVGQARRRPRSQLAIES
jgi:urease accessory protein